MTVVIKAVRRGGLNKVFSKDLRETTISGKEGGEPGWVREGKGLENKDLWNQCSREAF